MFIIICFGIALQKDSIFLFFLVIVDENCTGIYRK